MTTSETDSLYILVATKVDNIIKQHDMNLSFMLETIGNQLFVLLYTVWPRMGLKRRNFFMSTAPKISIL